LSFFLQSYNYISQICIKSFSNLDISLINTVSVNFDVFGQFLTFKLICLHRYIKRNAFL